MELEKLSEVIAKRNNLLTYERYFTAEDVAEYLMLYKKHILSQNIDAEQAMNELFNC